MINLRFSFSAILTLLVCSPVCSQNGQYLTGQLEQLLYDQDEDRDETAVCEELQDLLENPIDLNRATASSLESSGLFTFYQIRQIIDYREKYGMLLSIYELSTIPGFPRSFLEKMLPYITVIPPDGSNRSSCPRTTAAVNLTRKYPLSRGYTAQDNGNSDEPYPGSPWKTDLRIKATANASLSLGFACGKDPGERFFTGSVPEQISGYISYDGTGSLEKLIAGTFRMQHGSGLVQGSGSFLSSPVPDARIFSVSTLKPYAGMSLQRVRQGLIARFDLDRVTLTAWSTFRRLDLSFFNLTDATESQDWILFERTTGMHRSGSEIRGRNLGYLGNVGTHLLWFSGKFAAGLQWSSDVCGLTRVARDSLGLVSARIFHHTAGLHWTWSGPRLVFYGEAACDTEGNLAILSGLRYTFNDFLSGGLQYHYYSPGYRDVFSSAYGSGSHMKYESGAMVYFDAEPAPGLHTILSLETFHFPSPGFRSDVPSTMVKLRLLLGHENSELLNWQIRVSGKTWQTTEKSFRPGTGVLVRHDLVRTEGRLILDPLQAFSLQSRLVVTISALEGPRGMAFLQQVTAKLRDRVSYTLQMIVFSVPDWEQRIYLYEPGLYRQFSFPVYNGSGQKLTTVLTCKPSGRINLGIKISAIRYNHQATMGSGSERIEGNRKWETGGQLRFRF